MKRFSIFKMNFKQKLQLLLCFAITILSIALILLSAAHIHNSSLNTNAVVFEHINGRHLSELAAGDYFSVARTLENDLTKINWISVSLTSHGRSFYSKSRNSGLYRFLSATSESHFPSTNGLTLRVTSAPNREEVMWLFFVNICTILVAAFSFLTLLRYSTNENYLETKRTNAVKSLVHDLRGMVGTIKTLAVDADAESRLETINLIAERINILIAQTTNIETSASKSLGSLIEDVFHSFPFISKSHLVEIDPKLKKIETSSIAIDPTILWRVFYNLIQNASHRSTKASTITISCSQSRNVLTLKFADNGIGVPPLIKSKLFALGTTHGKPDGTGTGLAFIRDTLEGAGSSIKLDDTQNGARFTLTFPLKGSSFLSKFH